MIKVLVGLVPSEGSEEGSVPCLSPAFGGLLAIFDGFRLVEASPQSNVGQCYLLWVESSLLQIHILKS